MVIISYPEMPTGDLTQRSKGIQLLVEGTNQMANTYEYGQQKDLRVRGSVECIK